MYLWYSGGNATDNKHELNKEEFVGGGSSRHRMN